MVSVHKKQIILKSHVNTDFLHSKRIFDHYLLLFMSGPILPIRRIRKLHRALETPVGPLVLKDYFILVSFLNLASGYENMNDHLL